MKKRILSILLTLTLLLQGLPAMSLAAGDPTYQKVDLTDIKSTDTVIIVATKSDGKSYAMSNDKGSSNPPLPVAVTVAGDTITTSDTNILWNITNDNGNLTIYPAGQTDTWLYCTSANNGVRVGTNANNIFTIDAATGYLKNTATSRYLGVYNSQDWRCYTNTTGNTANQTFAFYKLQEAKHEHTYTWDGNAGANGSHTLTCANTDGKCDAPTTTQDCAWEDGFCGLCGAAAPECAHPTTTEVAQVPATCTQGGYTAGIQCTVCNQYISGHEEINPLGHTEVTDDAVDATCTATGLTEGSHCSVCEKVLAEQTTVPPLGHNYVSGICTRCNEAQPTTLTITRDSFGTASGYAWHDWTAATTKGDSVSGSGFIYGSEKSKIQLNGSKAGDYIYNTTPLPGKIVSITLTKASGTDRNFDILTSDTPFDSATAASLKGQATDAKKTVTEDGATWTFETNHKYFAIVIIDSSAAYLSSIEIAYTVCAHANKVAIGEAKEATCTEEGITAGSKCADCGEVLEAQKTLEAPGHNFENGVCTRCEEAQCTQHRWVDGDVIEPATCAKTGLQAQYCASCNEPGDDKVLDKLPHTPVTDEAVDATCTATGLTEGSHCSVCEEVLIAQTVLPMTNHTYENGICSVCGDITLTGTQLAVFQFGENGSEGHKDGTAIKENPISGDYTLTLTAAEKVYDGAFDAKGNSALKLGTSSAAASFTFTVTPEVNQVVLYIAGYKGDTAKVDINGNEYEITSLSNDGSYTKIVVDTSTTKIVTLTTLKDGYRAMIDSIELWGEGVNRCSVTLGSNIGVNFYMEFDAATLADENAYVEFTAPNGATQTFYVKDVTPVDGHYPFTCEIAAKEMSQKITGVLKTENGTVASNPFTYSVREYAMYIINNPDSYTAQDIAMVKAMLNYGAYAQLMFGYQTDDLANSGIDSTLADVTIDANYTVEGAVPGATYLGTTTLWEANTSIRHYFDITGENITFKHNDEDLAVKTNQNGSYIAIGGILPQDMDKNYTVVISDGSSTQTVTYSVYAYFQAILDGEYTLAQKDAMKAAYLYSQAAKAYASQS